LKTNVTRESIITDGKAYILSFITSLPGRELQADYDTGTDAPPARMVAAIRPNRCHDDCMVLDDVNFNLANCRPVKLEYLELTVRRREVEEVLVVARRAPAC
jgi:hypothetical protein